MRTITQILIPNARSLITQFEITSFAFISDASITYTRCDFFVPGRHFGVLVPEGP